MGSNHSRRTSDPTPLGLSQRRVGSSSVAQQENARGNDEQGETSIRECGRTIFNNSNISSAGRDINTVHNSFSYHYSYSGSRSTSYDDGLLELLGWLSENNFRNVLQDNLLKRAQGTRSRFLRAQMFVKWIEGHPGVLWGTGIPGAGKTVLASIIIEHLRHIFELDRLNSDQARGQTGTRTLILFAFCRYSDALSVSCILAALIRQALEHHIEFLPIVQRLRSLHQLQQTRPAQEELFSVLVEISKSFGRVFFILDGVDELRDEVRHALIRLVSSLDIHLLLTSRPLPYDEGTLANAQRFDVVADGEDIDCLLRSRLAQLPGLKALLERESLTEDLIFAVRQNAKGMFLHAALQMEMLRYCRTVGDIQLALGHLPPDLDALYADTLNRIRNAPEQDAARGMRILMWTVFAARPLKVDELQYILATSPISYRFDSSQVLPEKSLLALCHGLITVESGTRCVRLVPHAAGVMPDAHSALALACISRLRYSNLPNSHSASPFSFEHEFKKYVMLEYAYKHWSYHLRMCASLEELDARVEQFIISSVSFPVNCDGRVCFLGPLHLASWYNLPRYLPCIVNAGHDLNGKLPKTNMTPLMLAAMRGNNEFSKALFSICGIRVDVGGSTKGKRRSTSFMSNLTNILRVSGVSVNEADHLGRTALFLAAKGGHTGVVEMLLQVPRIQVEQADQQGRTPLIIAASQGHYGVVTKLLQGSELNINGKDRDGRTALIHAAAAGHLEVLKILLQRSEVDVNMIDGRGDDAVSSAVKGGHLELVKLLLLDIPGIQVGTALRAKLLILASSSGDHAFVDALLRQA
ncbi:hypothetical protein BKA70DRAFT_1293295 [Coprinopsis sp. MPI-PUGE-AT-0042]|nr:hypothetical protein BKA70DRAFT_1293295 [Coprinopsis sp. MPI-PUGE-AT-0042]